MKHISSSSNSTIKRLIQLKAKAKARKTSGEFIIEGQRELELALKGGYTITEIYVVPELININRLNQQYPEINIENCTTLSPSVFAKVAHRSTTEGIIAIAKSKLHSLANLKFNSETPLILIAEAPEKPGNIGALLRTADAANLDAVIIANPKTDMYNPNIIRSSVGTVFTNQIATCSTQNIVAFLNDKNIRIYAASLQNAVPYTQINFNSASAIVVGTENAGLSNAWINAATQNIIIPMEGKIDSMNVSVSAGIIIFEAKRQRQA